MSDNVPVEPEKPVEQENPAAPASPEAQPNRVQEPSLSAVKRSQRGVVSLICGIASIVLTLLTLLPGSIAWVGYLGLVATLIALLAGRSELRAQRKQGKIDPGGRKLAQAGIATGLLGFLALVALLVLTSVQSFQQAEQRILLAAQSGDVKEPTSVPAASAPKVYDGEDITLTYPGDWEQGEGMVGADCVDCLMLTHPYPETRSLLVFQVIHPPATERNAKSAEEADEWWWSSVVRRDRTILESRQLIQVDQRPAIKRSFHDSLTDSYDMTVALADNGNIYILWGEYRRTGGLQ